MRQNMEELQATQEEMARKQGDHEDRIKAINTSGIGSVEFSLNGQVLDANQTFLTMMGYRLDEVQGKHHRLFVPEADAETEEYRKFWEDLRSGKVNAGTFRRLKRSREPVYLNGSYNVLRDSTGAPQKILKLAMDVTSLMTDRTLKK